MGSASVATARPEPRQTGRTGKSGRQGPFVLGRTRLVLGCSTASHGTVSSSTPARAKRPGSFHHADMPNTQVRPLADTRRRLLRCPLRGASRSRQPERRRWRRAHGARARHELWRIPLSRFPLFISRVPSLASHRHEGALPQGCCGVHAHCTSAAATPRSAWLRKTACGYAAIARWKMSAMGRAARFAAKTARRSATARRPVARPPWTHRHP